MKEHPDYKYRPRRKPKPLQHAGSGTSKKEVPKYSFPLPVPLIPPGFDPCSFSAMARSIFAPPTYPHPSDPLLPHMGSNPTEGMPGVPRPQMPHPMVPGFAPTVAFSHQDLATLFCMQQKNHYEKLLREHQETQDETQKRRQSSSSSIEDTKGMKI